MIELAEKPICDDLYCGLGGWAEGFLAEGYQVRGYDIEAHDYGTGGYPGTLILRDVRSIHGSELKDSACIVGSSPCQQFSYRAMPWKRAKALPPPYLGMELFQAQFRIQREASEAAGRYIPLVAENVRGAQKYVGRARWHYGSFYLWGDVPALMPITFSVQKISAIPSHAREAFGWNHSEELQDQRRGGTKIARHANIRDGFTHTRHLTNQRESDAVKVSGISLCAGKSVGFNVVAAQRYREGVKFSQSNEAWFDGTPRDKMLGDKGPAAYGSRSNSRKAASAMIAKIPFPLAQYIAKHFKPEGIMNKEFEL